MTGVEYTLPDTLERLYNNQLALESAIMKLTLLVESQGHAETSENIRSALQAIGNNEERIRQGLAMSQTENADQQLQEQISELKAQYQILQDSYDDEVLLCVSILRSLVDDDYDYCKSLVKRSDCSAERKADTLKFIGDVRAGYS